MLQGVDQLLVGGRLAVEPVLRRDLVVAPVGGRVGVVVDLLVERRGVIGHAAGALAAQHAARRLGGRLELELGLLGHVAALREHVAAALALGAVAARGQEHDHRDRGDGQQPAAAVAHELLAPLRGLVASASRRSRSRRRASFSPLRRAIERNLSYANGRLGGRPTTAAAALRGGASRTEAFLDEHDDLVRQPLGREAELEDRGRLHEPGIRQLAHEHVGVRERVDRIAVVPDHERLLGHPAPLLGRRRHAAEEQAL